MGLAEHRLRRRVNFYEVDSAGIVHFSCFYRYMEEAEHALWRSVGLDVKLTSDVGYPRVAAAFDFKRPLRFDDEFEIALAVEQIGRTSLQYRCTISRGADVMAVGTMTIVCVRLTAAGPTAMPWPEHIRTALGHS